MADLVERLRSADMNSQQRVLGSRIFGEAADEITRLRAALTARDERMRAEGAREAQAKIARLTNVLKKYKDDFCEGFCMDCPWGYVDEDMIRDCSGCLARAALQENANE